MIENNDDDDDVNTKVKIYPFIGNSANRKGYYIGNIKTSINSNKLPFTNFDQVDHMLFNLFSYVKDRDTINNNKYFIYHAEDINFVPKKIIQEGGIYRKTIKKTKKSKTKKSKTKTKKSKTHKR